MLPNRDTLKRWRQAGIAPPCTTVDPRWRCPVCNAHREELRYVSDKTPEAVACSMCDLPFSLPHMNKRSSGVFTPLPAVSDDWVKAWRYAFGDEGFKKICRASGNQKLTQVLTIFPSALDAIAHFEWKGEEVSE